MMRRVVVVILFWLLLVMLVCPSTPDSWGDTSHGETPDGSDDALGVVQRFITALRDLLFLFGAATIGLLNAAWELTPEGGRFICGIMLGAILVLAGVGTIALGAIQGLLGRLLG